MNNTTGSSPLTRGALWVDFLGVFICGLIPAHAGSTDLATATLWLATAHPRSRGEH